LGRATPEGPLLIVDNGLQYEVDLAEGQKTGFYLDQRDNRAAAARYFRDRRVLDMFCYKRGFAMAASALGGAREVSASIQAQRAVTLAWANAQRNGLQTCDSNAATASKRSNPWPKPANASTPWCLDPPKFRPQPPRHRRSDAGLSLAQSPGRWRARTGWESSVTCSCSGHVSREDFLYMLVGVSQQTGRAIQVLEQRGARARSSDIAACLESEYLKCFICRVA